MAPLNKNHDDEPWWADGQRSEPVGCCSVCPVASGCPLRSQTALRCAVTGDQPPPPPPGIAPDLAESVGQDPVVAMAETVSWADVTAAVAEQAPSRDGGGNDPDWGRLQPFRNLLSIAVVSFLPVGGTTAARWVADSISSSGITAPVLTPLGFVLAGTGAVFLGQLVPGLTGFVCALAWKALVLTGRGLVRLVRSPRGWIITRPALWAAGIGVLIVSWRAATHFLTGAS
ncbi:hypothetical protein P1P75_05925 [Streptomyces sp. ID05-39B]|uniref:hypothetical protein n=1 Tax=Streptomyces sp. ID05-39B TaxID=3028664 RepID=UPI0029A52DA4|nr:hypothetical protein [Streptomyces sp. ID05-39B]MDX3525984.1 hypothetical protein [Streptomyces sp. ID05-39B]